MAKLITELEIKTSEAKNKIKELREAIKKGDGDVVALKDQLKKLEEQDKLTASSLREIKKSTEDAKKSFSGLKDALKGFDGSFDSFKNIGAALKDAKGAFSSLSSVSGGAGGAIANMAGVSGGLGAAMGALVNPVTLAGAAVAGIGAVCVEAVKRFADFKGSLNDLEALTGASKETMKELQKGIIQVSNETGVAAKNIAASMGLIGSQAPQLLDVPKSLLEVTKAANTLAQAAGIAAEDAAKGVTTILNQLGTSADDANGIVNALAAGQQKGAASVEYLNKVIEKTGTNAKEAGMGYTELISVIEQVAPKFSSADNAGTLLNNVLFNLSKGADEFNPAVVGLETALDNLTEAGLSNAEMGKLVGDSQVVMMKALLEAKDSFGEFREMMAEAASAEEQANIKTQGISAAVDGLSLAWDNFLLSLGGSDDLQGITDSLAVGVNLIADAIKFASDNMDILISYFKVANAPLVALLTPIRVAYNIITGIYEVIKGTKTPLEALGEVGKTIIKPFTNIYELVTGIVDKIKGLTEEPEIDWESLKFTTPKKEDKKEDKKDPEPKAGVSIKSLEDEIKDIKKQYEEATDAVTRNNLKKVLDEKEKALKQLKGETDKTNKSKSSKKKEEVYDEGSIAGMKKQLEKLKKEFETTASPEIRADVKVKADKLQKEIDKLEGKVKIEPEEGSLDYLNEQLKKFTEQYNKAADDASRKIAKESMEATKKQIDDITGETQKKIDDAAKKLSEKIKKANEDYKKAQESLVSGKTDAIKTIASEFDNLTDSIVAFSDAIQNGDGFAAFEAFGQSILNTLDNIQQFSEAMNQMKTAQQATSAAVAAGASTEIAANSAKAASNIATTGTELTAAGAKATSSAAGLPFPANLAAMAAALGAVMSMVSMVKGLGKFANGGIVSGATSIGDYNLARVNSGEMILNGKQQQNLFNQLNQPSQRAESGGNSNVQFKISGRELVGVLNNYNTFRN